MTNLRIGTIMLALGLAVGGGATTLLRPIITANAAQSMSGMSSGMRSGGNSEMDAAMNRMTQAMTKMKPSGIQDKDFMTMMIFHHQSAVDMANIELRRGAHPQLKSLARNVIRSQNAEIVQMRAWLKAWYGDRS